MRKIILLLTMAILAMASTGQTYSIIDTVIPPNIKHTLVKERLTLLEQDLSRVFDREKVQTDTMTYLNQTKAMVKSFWDGYNLYEKIFQRYDTLTYLKKNVPEYQLSTGQTLSFEYYLNGNDSTGMGLVSEWDLLNIRISDLQSNPDIKYLEAVNEFKTIKTKQEYLTKIFQQLQIISNQ